MSEIPRPMAATAAGSATRVARVRRSVPNGMWAMLLLIAAEATLLSTLIGTYFYLRLRTAQWPPAGIAAPSVALPLALTGALLLTTVPMVLAGVAARAGRGGRVWALVAAATVVQGGYLAWQIVAYVADLDKFSPADTAYGSIYFTLLAADHAHVALGILFNLWILARILRGLTSYRVVTVQAVAVYWVFVNVMTVLVTLTQVSAS